MSSKLGADSEWMPATEYETRRPLSAKGVAGNDANYKEIARGDEKVGEWDCEFFEHEVDGKRSKVYLHKKYGLVMKMVENGKVTMEITEFTPVE